MIELFADLSTERRVEILAGLNEVFNQIKKGNYELHESLKMLSDFADSIEDEQEREYCEFTTRILLKKMEMDDEENHTN